MPVVVRSSLMAKYFMYIGGQCEVPCNYFSGIILPWILGAVINHLQVFAYLVNWTGLLTCIFVQFVCPAFMWAKTVNQANVYENNFKQSMQMIVNVERESKGMEIESD